MVYMSYNKYSVYGVTKAVWTIFLYFSNTIILHKDKDPVTQSLSEQTSVYLKVAGSANSCIV